MQVNKQSYIQKNYAKLDKLNKGKTSKQQKRLFKSYSKTNLYVAQNMLEYVFWN